jgi:hypothetical protein
VSVVGWNEGFVVEWWSSFADDDDVMDMKKIL